MTVRATMDFYSKIKGTNHKNVEPLLEKLGLIEHLHKPVPLLSGGLKQRLALAVALLADPPLLLLDEPTANLDAKGRREYIESLNLLRNQGKTIVFASHRIEEVESIANRVIILGNGRVLDDLPTGEMRLRSSPEISLTLWIPENQRQKAKDTLLARGWPAHLHGRGTVVVQLTEGNKTNAFTQLISQGIIINDFEIEGVNN